MTRWFLTLEVRATPGFRYSGEKLRYIITDGSRECVMHAYPGAYFLGKFRVLWRNLTAVPSTAEVEWDLRMKRLEEQHRELEMLAAMRQFELEMAE